MAAGSVTPDPWVHTYVEGERVFGPPRGSFDREWVARDLERLVPGLDFARAYALVGQVWASLRAEVVDAPAPRPEPAGLVADLQRRAGLGADLAETVVERVLAFCDAYDVRP